MKTNLPQSRNRNLPAAPEAAMDISPRRRPLPPPSFEPRQGPSVMRRVLSMLIIGALFGGGIFFYIRRAETDVEVSTVLEDDLIFAGKQIWANGSSSMLYAAPGEIQKDLEHLPRVVAAIKLAKPNQVPVITLQPAGGGSQTIVFSINDDPLLMLRVQYDQSKPPGTYRFLGERNNVHASRKEMEAQLEQAIPPAIPAPPTPENSPKEPSPAPAPEPSPASGEKVSEQP